MTTRFSAPFGAVLTACLGLAAPLAAAPRVAVDIAPVHSLVARVMEGVAEPALIVPPNATPHGYSLRPSEAAALDRADVVIWMGEGLTPWLEGAIDTLAGDAHRITLLGAGASTVLEFREGLAFAAADAEDGGHGHGHEDHDDHGDDDHGHEEATATTIMIMTRTPTTITPKRSTTTAMTTAMTTGMTMRARTPMRGSIPRMRASGSA